MKKKLFFRRIIKTLENTFTYNDYSGKKLNGLSILNVILLIILTILLISCNNQQVETIWYENIKLDAQISIKEVSFTRRPNNKSGGGVVIIGKYTLPIAFSYSKDSRGCYWNVYFEIKQNETDEVNIVHMVFAENDFPSNFFGVRDRPSNIVVYRDDTEDQRQSKINHQRIIIAKLMEQMEIK
jgi:uncharacterized membrane protein